jgi:hypothetical protein
MKVRAGRGINFSRKFWLNPNVKISSLSQIKNHTDNLNAIYQELITNFPNNNLSNWWISDRCHNGES